MRATLMYGAGDVRVEDVADAELKDSTDALVRVVRACVCGSDLHPYHQMPKSDQGTPMGHEFIGVVEEIGSQVSTLKRGDFVIAPFAYSDGTCDFCRGPADLVPARWLLGRRWRRRCAGRSRPSAPGRRHSGQGASR
jgi:threonine dehydrogenase-like Zn-dependent dehydrogenase